MLVAMLIRRTPEPVGPEDLGAAVASGGLGVPARLLAGARLGEPGELCCVVFADDDAQGLLEALRAGGPADAEEVAAGVYRVLDDQDFTATPRPTGGTPGDGMLDPPQDGRGGGTDVIGSLLLRRLRPGVGLTDFAAAWYPERGFRVPTRVLVAADVADPRWILTVGMSAVPRDEVATLLAGPGTAAESERRHASIDAVIDAFPVQSIFAVDVDRDLAGDPRPFADGTPGAGITPGG